LIAFLLCVTSVAHGQGGGADLSEAEGTWNALLKPTFQPSKTATVKDIVLERDRIRLLLDDGTLQFTQPIKGVVFGAVFHGKGRLQVSSANALEEQQLRYFVKQDGLNLEFSEATLSFTDSTYDEVVGNVHWSATPVPGDDLYGTRQQQREDLGANLLARVYKGVYSGARQRTALFVADVKTQDFGWVQARYDAMDPEEVSAGRWVDRPRGVGKQFDTWVSFPAAGRTASDAYRDPVGKTDYVVRSYQMDVTLSAGAELTATAKISFETRLAGERVLLFDLDSNMRVDKILDSQGQPLAFIQAREQKDRIQSYGNYVAVLLPTPTEQGQQETFEFHYGGKRAVRKVGNGNYFCESFGWYPARLESSLNEGDFATRKDFDITFHSPKKFTLVATGKKTSETSDGGWTISNWKSEKPISVAGFAFGDYKVTTEKAGNVEVDVYANRNPDDFMDAIQLMTDSPFPGARPGMPVGSLNPSAMATTIGAEMANTVRLFETFFGPYPYSRLAITNIPYSYGQGWPGLIYLSGLDFLDGTQKHFLGINLNSAKSDSFRAHESSHQWWGHRTGWKSYHDQWLSEGFADFSGNLYVQYRENPKEYFNRIREALDHLKEKDIYNHVYDSVGPIWMGQRLSSSESPLGYQRLVYEKGGYILHMLRQLLMDQRNPNPDAAFQAMMQDFTKTYDTQAASTEDFKAIVEKHMTPSMDLEGNHRMDWFFRQYVYGTGIPHYEFHYTVQDAGGGRFKVIATISRAGVPDGWMDALPLYLHSGSSLVRVGFLGVKQAAPAPIEIAFPSNPEKLSINDYLDTLADIKQ
jgi:hypothetical protein